MKTPRVSTNTATLRCITLPTELDVLAAPPLASISVLEAALAMIVAVIHCEHPDLDEIQSYANDGIQPPGSLLLAQAICYQSDDLRLMLDTYRRYTHPQTVAMKKTFDIPF
jgi:hypothetical protein